MTVTTTTIIDPDDLIQINVVLPARLAIPVQEMIFRLLEASEVPAAGAAWAPPAEMHSKVADAWDMPNWTDTPDDRQRMTWLVGDLDHKHVDVLTHIHYEPGTPTNELLAAAGYPEGAKASGVFRAITNRFRKVNRRPLWHGGDQTPEGQKLRSPGPLGDVVGIRLFAETVADLHDGTASAGPGDKSDWLAVVNHADFSETDVQLIEAFRSCPDNTAHAGQLSEVLGYKHYGGANLAIGRLGKRLSDARAEVDPGYEPQKRSDGSTKWWYEVATGEIHNDDGLFWWTLRPGLATALRERGI